MTSSTVQRGQFTGICGGGMVLPLFAIGEVGVAREGVCMREGQLSGQVDGQLKG